VNLIAVATVFGVIFLGELPDKTMFASLVMATRGRPGAVWLGAAAAFAIHVVFAVTLGMVAILLLPKRALAGVVAALFLAGAALSVREWLHARRHSDMEEPAVKPTPGFSRATATAFAVVFVAEWGDLTQVLTANLAAHFHAPLAVGAGALLALWAAAGIAVTGGRWMSRVIDASALRAGTAVLLTGLAAYAGWVALT
jgi:putative Ca2+/H+ antiporter (TMEM165/GDT1 family)